MHLPLSNEKAIVQQFSGNQEGVQSCVVQIERLNF